MRARCLDWLIHELQDDLDYHYKINLIVKNEGFVINKCFEIVMQRAIFAAGAIPYENVNQVAGDHF